MDGAEVLHKLKAIRELRRIPVYIISAREQQDGLLKQGIVGYMTKPVDTRQLADAQALILDRASGADSILLVEGASLTAEYITGIVQSDDLVIHPATDLATALELLAESPALAVVDIERAQRESLEICRELKRHDKMLPIILYGDRELSAEEEAELQEFSDSIIIKTPQAEQRILENIERFLQEVPSAADIERGAVSGIGQHSGEILKGRQILVVDDDPRNLFVVASALEQAGASVDTALNGAKALSYLREKGADINIIFMDIMMPEMDGCEAIGEIKGDPMLRHIPLVALTAKAMRSDKENLLAVGADDYLSKPVDYEVLVNMASLWCESKV